MKKETYYKTLTKETWADFEALFGEHGAYGGCWCMYWRETRREFRENCGAGNKAAMWSLVEKGVVPGILVYKGMQAIGWVSVAPREDFGSLERSHKLKRIDEKAVWSIVCFYAPKNERGNLMRTLIRHATAYARSQGAEIVEAYPYRGIGKKPEGDLYMGSAGCFLAEGFVVMTERGSQLLMRKQLRA